MRLSHLLQAAGLPVPEGGGPDPEVAAVVEDSRAVVPGALFVAIRGTRGTGTDHLADALANGAVAVVAAIPAPDVIVPAPQGATGAQHATPWIVTTDERRALARLAAALHGFPGRSLTLSAITGSKGKTTTSFLIASVCEAAGEPSALLGTVLYRTGGPDRPAPLTTPSAPQLQALLAEAVAGGRKGAVIEVSSHGLDQERVHGLEFDTAVFTNLYPDHLDYHPTVEDYFEAKRRLFTGTHAARRAAIGIDSRHGLRLAAERADAITFGSSAEASVRPLDVAVWRGGIKVVAALPDQSQVVLESPLLGRFNVWNLLAAAAYAEARGLHPDALHAGVRALERVPGRMEAVDLGQPFTCLVDFSHTGPALTAALEAVREWTSGRVLVVFGAGGNRDRARRRSMGEAAAHLAELSFITSDNPRDEEPEAILQEIVAGYEAAGGDTATVIPDRAEAIAAAVRAARPGDTVLVAGKGHETVQIVGSVRRHFDDREAIAEALAARGMGP